MVFSFSLVTDQVEIAVTVTEEPKRPSRPPAPRLRDSAPRFRYRGAGDKSSVDALRGLMRLLARQAAGEFFNDTDAGESR